MSDSQNRSVIVIGGGPGGYVAAIRAAQLGAKVTLIEKKNLGGTCLNVGCIPTKALLHPAEILRGVEAGKHCGIHLSVDSVNWKEVRAYKDSIVSTLVGGVRGLLRSSKVNVVEGLAQFIRPRTIRVEKSDGTSEIMEADRFIIATGSVPVMPPIEGLRESRYVIDSTGALNLEELPATMVIIGGGVIGVEMACAFQALGCQITIVEALPKLVPTLDGEMAGELAKSLEQQGIILQMNHKVVRIVDGADGAQVVVDHNGSESVIETKSVLCAVGRRPYIDGLNVEAGGIAYEKNRILVNDSLETNVPGVYAIGDCVGQIMLAHTASAMGEVAAENAMGLQATYRPACVPSGIYAFPEMASVGMTEEEVKAQGIAYHAARFPLKANGRSLITNGGEGMVKILIGNELDELLGVHILGPNAMEMIGEAAVAISMEATVHELIDTIHAHPTVTESIREAALAAEGRAIHIPNKAKKG